MATFLAKFMAIFHSNIPAWRIPWTEEPGGPWSTGWQRVDRLKRLSTHVLTLGPRETVGITEN